MYSTWVFVTLLFAILPRYILATGSEKQNLPDQQVTQKVLQLVGDNAYTSYNKNIKAMKHHTKRITAIDKQYVDTFWKHVYNRKIQSKNMEKVLEHSKKVWQQAGTEQLSRKRKKHSDGFDGASQASGQQFQTNRLLHATMPNMVKPLDNVPKKALLLVAENAIVKAKKWAKVGRYHDKELSNVNAKIPDVWDAESNRISQQHKEDLNKQHDYHLAAGLRAPYQATKDVYTNQILGLTVKGVKPEKLGQWAHKQMASWSKTGSP